MFDIYEKKINSPFAGPGVESLVVKDGIIRAHVRGWNDPSIVDTDFTPVLKGKPVGKRGKGWRKLSGEMLKNDQGWAEDVARDGVRS